MLDFNETRMSSSFQVFIANLSKFLQFLRIAQMRRKLSSYVCFVLTCSAFAEHHNSDWFNLCGDLEGPSRKPGVRPVTRPSSLDLSDHHTGCWCCPVCRLTRTRRSDALSGPIRCRPRSRTDRDARLLKDSLPLPLPSVDADIYDINEENVTEVSVLSEESYFTREKETSVQSGSFRHFEVDLSFLSDDNYGTLTYYPSPCSSFRPGPSALVTAYLQWCRLCFPHNIIFNRRLGTFPVWIFSPLRS